MPNRFGKLVASCGNNVFTLGTAGNYRYGFNGKENLDDVKGFGNEQDYGMRIYDPRVAKFLSVDPLASKYPWYSPYHFAGNSPIMASDLDGKEVEIKIGSIPTGTTKIKLINAEENDYASSTVEVNTYPMTVFDKATNTTSIYQVTRDGLYINENEKPNEKGNLNVNNFAFEPVYGKNHFKGKETYDYPEGTDFFAIKLTQNGSNRIPAIPNGNPWRENQDFATNEYIHLGGDYTFIDKSGNKRHQRAGSRGCFGLCEPIAGNVGISTLMNDIKNRKLALESKSLPTEIDIEIEKRNNYSKTLEVPAK